MARNQPQQPAKLANPQARQQAESIQSQSWSGPLPPPSALQQFDQVIPNGAERIMAMVEREQAHRIEHEITLLQASIADTKRGHWMGLVISLAAVAAAFAAAYLGAHPAVSIAIVGLPIAAVVKAILASKTKH